MSAGWLEIAKDALKLPNLLVEVYGDLARPGVRQVGKALETVFGLGNTILWPVTWTNERTRIYLESNLEKYRVRMARVSQEDTISVVPEIGVPIAEKFAYVHDKSLSDLYVELLATASDSNTVHLAHPSFVHTINCLSPDEARALDLFHNNNDLVFVTAKWVNPKTGVFTVAKNYLLTEPDIESFTYPQNLPAYMANMVGLGLIETPKDRVLEEKGAYEPIIRHWQSRLPKNNPHSPDQRIVFEREVAILTDFGRQFLSACHRRESQPFGQPDAARNA